LQDCGRSPGRQARHQAAVRNERPCLSALRRSAGLGERRLRVETAALALLAAATLFPDGGSPP